MAAGERFSISSFTTATSLIIAQNDQMPARLGSFGGLNIAVNANSSWLGTLAIDNGVGVIDITSLMTGAGSIGGGAGGKLYRISGFFPWKVWMNVTSIAGSLNVSVSNI